MEEIILNLPICALSVQIDRIVIIIEIRREFKYHEKIVCLMSYWNAHFSLFFFLSIVSLNL